MPRSVYQLLHDGVPWERLTSAQRLRWHRDAYYYVPRPQSQKFLPVNVEDAPYVRKMAAAKAMHRKLDRAAATRSHSLHQAFLAAKGTGDAEVDDRLVDAISKQGNNGRHSYKYEDDHTCGKKPRWADQDDSIPESWEDYLASPAVTTSCGVKSTTESGVQKNFEALGDDVKAPLLTAPENLPAQCLLSAWAFLLSMPINLHATP